jgi:transcriptional regulator with XRE-family HTH domain
MPVSRPRAPNRADQLLARRLRQRRVEVGKTQQALAEDVGLSQQMIQRYESAESRISPSRLFDIAQALDVPPGYFLEELQVGEAPGSPKEQRPDVTPDDHFPSTLRVQDQRQAAEVSRLLAKLPATTRRSIMDLLQLLVDTLEGGEQPSGDVSDRAPTEVRSLRKDYPAGSPDSTRT